MTKPIWPAAAASSATTDPHAAGALLAVATRLIGARSSAVVQRALRTGRAAADDLEDESATSSDGRRRRPSPRRLQLALACRERGVEGLARAAIVAESEAHDEEVRRLAREHERARISAVLVQQPQVETDFPGAVG
jgi:hypothetical protein